MNTFLCFGLITPSRLTNQINIYPCCHAWKLIYHQTCDCVHDLYGCDLDNDHNGRCTYYEYVKIKSLGRLPMEKSNQIKQTLTDSFSAGWLAGSRLYRSQILQVNMRWKALDEIYKIYMILHRSDLNISANFHRFFTFSTLEGILKSSLFFKFRRDFRWF